MAISLAQNFYKETVATAWAAGAGNFYVSAKPTNSTGYLVISPNNEALREIVKYTAIGTDGGGDYVTLTAANRGLGGTTDQTHAVGESVFMNITAETIAEIDAAIDAIVAAGALYATDTTKGISKMSTDPTNTLGTVTVTIASPAVFTFTSHGLAAGDIIQLTTTGSLPTGLATGTTYYVISTGLTANTFEVSTSLGGSAVDTSGSQSGTHTLVNKTPIAVSDTDTRIPSTDITAALAGGGDFGTPSASNKFATEDFLNAQAAQIVTFDASGTWTKDAGLTRVRVQVWGAGGSGGRVGSLGNSDCAGGGGGGYREAWFEAADLGATETVTIGAGGVSRTTDLNGASGGTTSFGSLLSANGGSGGPKSSVSVTGGTGGGESICAGTGGTGTGGAGLFWGGGAGGGTDGSSAAGAGGAALFGGGGGGAAIDEGGASASGAGGVSSFGGNGGAGNESGNATAGSQPAGGGGGSVTGNSGAGGDGRVIVTEYYA